MTHVLRGHKTAVVSAILIHSIDDPVTASTDRTIGVWNAKDGELKDMFEAVQVAGSPDGGHVIKMGNDSFQWWRAPDGIRLLPLGEMASFKTASFSADGKLMVTASGDSTARLWTVPATALWGPSEQRALLELKGHDGQVLGAAISLDGTRIVTASADKTARVWDAATGTEIARLEGHSGDVLSAAFSSDGTRIMTRSADGTARVWETEGDGIRWRARFVIETGSDGPFKSVEFNHDGTRIVTAQGERMVKVWDLSSESASRTPKVVNGGDKKSDTNVFANSSLISASFSKDGVPRAVTTTKDGLVMVWEFPLTERKLRPFNQQLFAISSVSGGSLGAVVAYAAIADSQSESRSASRGKPPCIEGAHDTEWFRSGDPTLENNEKPHNSWRSCLELITAGDFLSPVFVSLVSTDPFPLRMYGDRAAVLEQAWEMRYAQLTSPPRPSSSILAATPGAARQAQPVVDGGTIEDGLSIAAERAKQELAADADAQWHLGGHGPAHRGERCLHEGVEPAPERGAAVQGRL